MKLTKNEKRRELISMTNKKLAVVGLAKNKRGSDEWIKSEAFGLNTLTLETKNNIGQTMNIEEKIAFAIFNKALAGELDLEESTTHRFQAFMKNDDDNAECVVNVYIFTVRDFENGSKDFSISYRGRDRISHQPYASFWTSVNYNADDFANWK